MVGQWMFVLLCISSLVGDLVLGSMFPNTPPNPSPPPEFITTQQEVNWPLKNLATPAEVIAAKEVKTDDRVLQVKQTQEKNWESDRQAVDVSPKIIVINNDQKPVSGILIHNTTQDENKKSSLTTK